MTTTVERAIAFRDVEAFRDVPIEQLAYVAAVAREERLAAGTELFREGDPPGGLYVIVEGRITLHRGGKAFGEVGAGEPLGTWSLFDDQPRRATARVDEDTLALVVERDDFYDVLTEHVEITRHLVQYLVRRLMELTGVTNGEAE
jgi:CRP-like cAMP-binding protein